MAQDIHRRITNQNLMDVCDVGLSMGGRAAMRPALDYPQDVAALVPVSAKSEPAREIRFELEALATRAEQGQLNATRHVNIEQPDCFNDLRMGLLTCHAW